MSTTTRPSRARRRSGGVRVARAYAEIRRRILDNEYPAGYQATEPEVAEALGMSRTPVREALIRLEKEGFVEVVPRREDHRALVAAVRRGDEGRRAPCSAGIAAAPPGC